LQVARVGEGIQIDHRLVAHAKPVEYEVCTDKAGAAGYENHLVFHLIKYAKERTGENSKQYEYPKHR